MRWLWPFTRKADKPAVRSYEGASQGRRWRGQADMPTMITAVSSARGPLARRARHLAANNPLATSGVEAWVSALVGCGIKPQAVHGDESVRAALNLAFEAWTDIADADGLGDFYAVQALMVRRMVVDGEAFAVLVHDGDRLQVRLIDSEQVDASLTRPTENGGMIIQGVELDSAGRRVAYWILPQRPGLIFGAMPLTPRRVPAEDVIHMFRPETPGQVRGVSWFAPVMLRLSDLDSWRDAQLVRQKVAAMLAGFVTSADSLSGAPMVGEDDGQGSLSGGLEPGTLKFLDPGQDIKFSDPAKVGAEVIDFAKMTEREIAAGLGIPVAQLTGDLSDVNYSSIRAGLVEFRRRVEALQHGVICFQALRPIWRRWAAIEALSGRVGTTVAEAQAVRWIVPKQAWVDPAKDVQAERDAIAGGLMSRREAVASRGYDIEALDSEIAEDQARAARLGLDFSQAKKESAHAEQ